MAKTIYYLAQSLDGFLARPDGDLSWLMGYKGREREGVEASAMGTYDDLIAGTGVLVTGSGTYEWVMDREKDWPYELPTYLFSSRDLEIPEGRDVRIVSGDVADHHSDVVSAAGGRNIWLIGGGNLAIQYHRADLLDELHLTVVPVVLGEGIPTFAGEIEGELDLIDTTVLTHGMVGVRYRLPGASD